MAKIELRVTDSRTFEQGEPPQSVTVALLVPVNPTTAPPALGAPGTASAAPPTGVPATKLQPGVRVDGSLTVTIVGDEAEGKRLATKTNLTLDTETGKIK
jgi:hypothetical protein